MRLTYSFNSRTPGGVRLIPAVNDWLVVRVSIHAPREGCDVGADVVQSYNELFQFTHPGRGATRDRSTQSLRLGGFNSRTPGGVRQIPLNIWIAEVSVSIHAPREGCDQDTPKTSRKNNTFQFTHPGRGATRRVLPLPHATMVSIHAPREGCDLMHAETTITDDSFNSRTPGGVRPRAATPPAPICGFNSRTPGGVRRSPASSVAVTPTFQFTHPGRGATSPRH